MIKRLTRWMVTVLGAAALVGHCQYFAAGGIARVQQTCRQQVVSGGAIVVEVLGLLAHRRVPADAEPPQIIEALREPKRVDPLHDVVMTARAVGISFGD